MACLRRVPCLHNRRRTLPVYRNRGHDRRSDPGSRFLHHHRRRGGVRSSCVRGHTAHRHLDVRRRFRSGRGGDHILHRFPRVQGRGRSQRTVERGAVIRRLDVRPSAGGGRPGRTDGSGRVASPLRIPLHRRRSIRPSGLRGFPGILRPDVRRVPSDGDSRRREDGMGLRCVRGG